MQLRKAALTYLLSQQHTNISELAVLILQATKACPRPFLGAQIQATEVGGNLSRFVPHGP